MTLPQVQLQDSDIPMSGATAPGGGDAGEAGLGALVTDRGNLPLRGIDAAVHITGLVGLTVITQRFHNPHDVPLEATYIFPLPDRAAVTAMTLTAADRTVSAQLRERGQARKEYDDAVSEGKRAAIAEEERPDVFTMRVGNILPGEQVGVTLTLTGPLSYEDGEATYRLPLVVAPRYIPGRPLGGDVGSGSAHDTDAVPDGSRITPPVLLPGFPDPVELTIGVDIDAAGLPLGGIRSSLHAVAQEGNHLAILPGERANRDFILRLAYGQAATSVQALTLIPDAGGTGPAVDGPAVDGQAEGAPAEGTFRLTVLPPTSAAPPRPRDVVLLLDRSGSMAGWKMVAARRAASRIVDTLTGADRFAVIAFDDRIEQPGRLAAGLSEATDRHRYAAVEFLSRMDSRGGTELLAPLRQALGLLTDAGRDRVIVLVTDGQVGNEDQILNSAGSLADVRVHTVGIDQAVNAGFLGRLAAIGGGRCELVESEDRLDTAMDAIHRRIGAPVVAGLALAWEDLQIVPETVSPARLPDLFPGAPLVVTGRYRMTGAAIAADATGIGTVTVTGRTRAGDGWSVRVPAVPVRDEATTAVWARAYLRDREDRYASLAYSDSPAGLERQIVATSLRFGVLCRFTAWVAVDERVVTEGGTTHKVVQPVEFPAGWDGPRDLPRPMSARVARVAFGAPMPLVGGAGGMLPPGAASAGRGLGIGRSWAKRADTLPGKTAKASARDANAPMQSLPVTPIELDAAALADVALLALRPAASGEAARLRAAATAPDYEKRELLADLGTRLQAFSNGFGAAPEATTPEAAAVRSLLAELADESLARLTAAALGALFNRVLAVLDALATTGRLPGPAGGQGDGPASGPGDGPASRHGGGESVQRGGESGRPGPSGRATFWKKA